ncbi:auxin-responsive protein SAUR32-like [Trifolium pratense]|uniref:auxin-responsive protein SAUR32-like n=1 Tax=Trifolium pratense TaxID=57577 RepID=UPI001E6911EF|nr:auxin-responsive protein SAUR32-like [Trifolium pratense]
MGISGNHHHHLSFHIPRVLNFHHHNEKNKNILPKGYLAVLVGQNEEQQRLVIPLFYVNHPLFIQLLKTTEEEEEYEFKQNGLFTIPCKIDKFHEVQRLIDMEKSHHHRHHAWCFKV